MLYTNIIKVEKEKLDRQNMLLLIKYKLCTIYIFFLIRQFRITIRALTDVLYIYILLVI